MSLPPYGGKEVQLQEHRPRDSQSGWTERWGPVIDMTTSDLAKPNDTQQHVVSLPIDARVFVIAGPGAGKTFTLLERAEALRSEPDVGTGRVLVLSFTRAVVDELRRRDRVRGASTSILAETFDSFASRMLREYATGDAWQRGSYDDRIEACTELIGSGHLDNYLEDIRHVFLDEVQDLVGPRARLVRELLSTYPGGFTAFGDPCQAIYDFADDNDGADSILASSTSLELADDSEILTGNHRFSDPTRAERIVELHLELLRNPDRAAGKIAEEVAALPTVDATSLPASESTRTAILCRSNVTALLISDALWAIGQPHRIRRSSSDRPVVGWVSALFQTQSALTETEFASRYEVLAAAGFPGLPPEGTAWDLLCRTDPSGRRRIVSEATVRSRIIVGRLPWGFFEQASSPLMISSVHSAKGLEFDDCIITDWDVREGADREEEARVRFVALTRARHRSFRMHWPTRQMFQWKPQGGRAFKVGRETWQTFGIEILGDDVHGLDPCGGLLLTGLDAARMQSELTANVRPGDLVELQLLGEHKFGTQSLPIYRVVHMPTLLTLGVTSESFGSALAQRLRRARGASVLTKPRKIMNIRIADLETVAGPAANAEAAGLGKTGLWLRPRLTGLGEIHWDKTPTP